MTSVIRPLSTYYSSIQGKNIVAKNRSEIETLGKELATGLKADVARSLGMRTSQSINLRNLMGQNDEYLLSNKLTDNKLEVLADQVGNIREDAQSFLNLAVSNTTNKTTTAKTLQLEAKAKLDAVIRSMNTNYNGEFLFSGVDSDKKTVSSPNETNPNTGHSPMGVVKAIIGGGITSLADANTKMAEIDDIFNSIFPADPTQNFESTFFNGTPLLDAGGTPNARMLTKPDEESIVEYGIQANDPEFRNVLKGLFMMASIDVTTINDPDAYKAWVGESVKSISNGIDNIIVTETKLGGHQREIVQAIEIQEDKRTVFNNRIVAMEHVDLFEAQTRMTALEVQMQATFSTTAKLARLTFLDYLR